MADSVFKFKNPVDTAKQNFKNTPLVQSIENHDDPIAVITKAMNTVSRISNVNLLSINGKNDIEEFTAKRFARAGRASLNDFINGLKYYGTTIKARYEVTFSGIENLSFFITDINIPSVRRNFGILHWHGQTVEIPVTVEYEHDFNITVINDGKGILYPTFVNLLLNMKTKSEINSGYTMTVRMFGDGQNDAGIAVMFFGVRFKTVSGLTANSGDTGISTFTVGCTAIKYDVLTESVRTNLLEDDVKNNIFSVQPENTNTTFTGSKITSTFSGITGRIGGMF